MFNFNNIFGIGVYNIEDDFSNSYSDGTAGINLRLHFELILMDRYEVNTIIKPISTGNVVNFGLLSNDILCLNDNDFVFAKSVQFSIPSNDSVYRFTPNLYKNNNFTCRGTVKISLETGGIPINDTINFQLSFFVPLNQEDYANINLVVYSLFFVHFFLYIIIPVLLIWIFKPMFGLKLSEEDIKRDENFLKYLRNQFNEKGEPIN
ncbi:MAG: hypothetical protein MUP85_15050 [Candidatus Lokiarchaeota archaeon]|nr:hypothetical protein [Candidatus Lokiarchaeota archaeon]